MPLDQLGELLIRFQPLPFQAGFPILKETLAPRLVLVIPQFPDRFLELVSSVEPLVAGIFRPFYYAQLIVQKMQDAELVEHNLSVSFTSSPLQNSWLGF